MDDVLPDTEYRKASQLWTTGHLKDRKRPMSPSEPRIQAIQTRQTNRLNE